MDKMPSSITPLLCDVRSDENLIPYLEYTGWQAAEETNNRWYVYYFHSDKDSKPYEILLPKNSQVTEYQSYLKNAIDLLAGLRDESIEVTVRRIVFYNADVLYSRNLETGAFNSITLKLAAQQVQELKNMVYYSACSENEPKPYFLPSQRTAGLKMVDHYRFGHTYRGSFGFTIECPILEKPKRFIQPSMFGNEVPPPPEMPFERRVMQRIVRGLAITKEATRKADTTPLLEEYASGFNANMCTAIVKMSQNKKVPIEYSVQWSPKYDPSEDVDETRPVLLEEQSYRYLEIAAEALRQLKPTYTTLRGYIIGLTAKDNPLGLETNRSVIVRGRVHESKRPIDVIIELEKDDYIKATRAHLEWVNVEVNGVLSRSGYAWRLTDYDGFNITP